MKKQTPPAEETITPEDSASAADEAMAEEPATKESPGSAEEAAEPTPPKRTSPAQTALAIVFLLAALAAAYWSYQKNFAPQRRPAPSLGPPANGPGM